MKNILLIAAAAILFSACAASVPNTQISELDDARMWIKKARDANAEHCAPKLQAKAVAKLYHAAHEYSENTEYHPDRNAELRDAAVKYAKQAYKKSEGKNCKPAPVVIDLKGVFFESNSDVIKPESKVILDRAVATLNKHSKIKVEVAAHTDNRGSDAYNKDLSGKRASSVMAYLNSHGIDASRLTSRGYGESRPIATNNSDAGRAKNRRVELRVRK